MVTVAPKVDGIALLYTTIVFMVIAWITFVVRVGVRVWRKALGMDDYVMAVGLVGNTPFILKEAASDMITGSLYCHSMSLHCVQFLWIRAAGCCATCQHSDERNQG